jgi:hypothetical protein
MKKRIFTLFAITAVLALTAVVASAETSSVTVTGGSLTSTAANVTLSGVTLDGTDQTATSTADSWQIVDARGTGAGYCITIDSTDYTSGGYTIDISVADQEFFIAIPDGDTVTNAGDAANPPASQVATDTAITTNPTTLNIMEAPSATDEGMGDYNYDPNFTLEVRAETYAGAYTATITITANSGDCV